MSKVPAYRAQQAMKSDVEHTIPDALTELWDALELAWENLEEAESMIEELEREVEGLTEDLAVAE